MPTTGDLTKFYFQNDGSQFGKQQVTCVCPMSNVFILLPLTFKSGQAFPNSDKLSGCLV